MAEEAGGSLAVRSSRCSRIPTTSRSARAGSLAEWAAAGREVHLLVLTNGDRGSDDPTLSRAALAATRLQETEAGGGAARIRLRARSCRPTTASCRTRRAFARPSCGASARFAPRRSCRATRPRCSSRTATTTTPITGCAGWVALDSVFPGSGNPHFFSEHLGEGLGVQEVFDVWLGWTHEPNRTEPIDAASFRKKVDALGLHASQITEGIAYWDEALGEGRARGGGEDRRRVRRAVPRPRPRLREVARPGSSRRNPKRPIDIMTARWHDGTRRKGAAWRQRRGRPQRGRFNSLRSAFRGRFTTR